GGWTHARARYGIGARREGGPRHQRCLAENQVLPSSEETVRGATYPRTDRRCLLRRCFQRACAAPAAEDCGRECGPTTPESPGRTPHIPAENAVSTGRRSPCRRQMWAMPNDACGP